MAQGLLLLSGETTTRNDDDDDETSSSSSSSDSFIARAGRVRAFAAAPLGTEGGAAARLSVGSGSLVEKGRGSGRSGMIWFGGRRKRRGEKKRDKASRSWSLPAPRLLPLLLLPPQLSRSSASWRRK